MQSSAKILVKINKTQIDTVSMVAEKYTADELSNFSNNDGAASVMPIMTKTEEDDFRKNLKSILIEEEMPHDKHAPLINGFVNLMNQYLQNDRCIRNCSAEKTVNDYTVYQQAITTILGYSEIEVKKNQLFIQANELKLQAAFQSIIAEKRLANVADSLTHSVPHFFASLSLSDDDSDSEINEIDCFNLAL